MIIQETNNNMKTILPGKIGTGGFLWIGEIQNTRPKNVLVFRTDIKTKEKVQEVAVRLNNHPVIADWYVDTEDIDNVLRIETSGTLLESDIVNLMKMSGFYCEILSN